jgi:hypothetical protein
MVWEEDGPIPTLNISKREMDAWGFVVEGAAEVVANVRLVVDNSAGVATCCHLYTRMNIMPKRS